MPNEVEIMAEVVAVLHESIHAASRDYFLWTRGRTLYDHGVESLLHAFAGRLLFERFASQYQVIVRLEHKLSEIFPGTSGRADLSMWFPSGLTIIVEFKRYFNASSIAADLARLRRIAALPQHRGILAGPGFIRENDIDWVARYAAELGAEGSGLIPAIGDTQLLPAAFRRPGDWNRSRPIVIHVAVPPEESLDR